MGAIGSGGLGLMGGYAALIMPTYSMRFGAFALRTGCRVLNGSYDGDALLQAQWWREQKLRWWVRWRDLQSGWREQKLRWWVRWRDLQNGWREQKLGWWVRWREWHRACRSFCEYGYIEFVMARLNRHAALLRPVLRLMPGKRVLYVGQAYYNSWYLSRELRKIGWKADLLNWNDNPDDQLFFHGQDFSLTASGSRALHRHFWFYLKSIIRYDIYHFAN